MAKTTVEPYGEVDYCDACGLIDDPSCHVALLFEVENMLLCRECAMLYRRLKVLLPKLLEEETPT